MKVGVTKRQKEEMTRKRRDRKQFFREKERKRERVETFCVHCSAILACQIVAKKASSVSEGMTRIPSSFFQMDSHREK